MDKLESDDLFARYPQATKERFKKFHSENPDVYAMFKRLAFEMKSTGKKKYSAETIINVMRWNYDLKTGGDVFQINNDFRSIYARLLVYHHPKFTGFFEFRDQQNKGKKSPEQLKREAELK